MTSPGEVDVYCNIHPGMKAKILVLQNNVYVATKADGTFRLDNVPAGSHTLVIWSPTHAPQKKVIEVKAGADAKLDLTLVKRKDAAHMNKNGEAYGRYK